MSDLGNLLRKARLEKGITLDELQEMTKIRKRYLEAIEEGQFSVLPGNFYARAFVKSYAEAVELNVDEVLRLLSGEIPAPQQETHTEHLHRAKRRSVSSETWSKWTSFAIAIAFPILIFAVIYYFFFYNAEPKHNADNGNPLTTETEIIDATPTPTLTPTAAGTPTPTPTPEQTEFQLLKTDEATNTEFYEIVASKLDIVLTLTGEECWVGLNKDNSHGEVLQQIKLQKGGKEFAEWTVDNTTANAFYLNIGNPRSIEVTINGKKMDMGTNPSFPKRFQMTLRP
ncbi:MAG TPA: RodZ domain-containing protein [Bacilli bacterium]